MIEPAYAEIHTLAIGQVLNINYIDLAYFKAFFLPTIIDYIGLKWSDYWLLH